MSTGTMVRNWRKVCVGKSVAAEANAVISLSGEDEDDNRKQQM